MRPLKKQAPEPARSGDFIKSYHFLAIFAEMMAIAEELSIARVATVKKEGEALSAEMMATVGELNIAQVVTAWIEVGELSAEMMAIAEELSIAPAVTA